MKALATRLASIAKPCDTSKVAALLDREEFVRLVEKRAPSHHTELRLSEIFFSTGANKFCAWLDGADEVRFLRVHVVDGEPRAVLRKISVTGFGYFDIRAKPDAKEPRLLDVYSYNLGIWISQDVADALMIPGTDDPKLALTVNRVNALDDQGKHAEALAALDSLPENVRNTRSIQSLRVAIAGRTSVEAHKQAMEERARRVADYKPTPFAAMNSAFARGDFGEALHQLDVLDAAIGGDPFLDAIRAAMLAQRNGLGDLEAAADRAERAAQAEPKLLMTHFVKLGIAMARSQWAFAVTTLDAVESNLGITLSEDELRGLPNAAGFFATPEYKEWRSSHP